MYNRERFLLLQQLPLNVINELEDVKAILAGGAITSVFCNREIKDFDIFFKNRKDVDKIANILSDNDFHIIIETETAITFKHNNKKTIIQLIKTYLFNSIEELFTHFDFTISMGAYDFYLKEFSFNEHFFLHNAQKRLKFNIFAKFPISSLCRVLKFQKKGYIISNIELVKISMVINSLNLNDYSELKRQLMGIDVALLKLILDEIEKKLNEPLNIIEFCTWIEVNLENYYNSIFEE